MKRLWLVSIMTLAALLLVGLATSAAGDVALAVQVTDVVRRHTVAAASTPSPGVMGWRGQVVSNTPYATSGNGSIVRVHVFERVDEPITLTGQDTTLSGLSGSKPEYGPYAAEFAPVAAGRWTVGLPDLGASVEIQTDGYNLVVVEFAPYTAAEASVAAQLTPTSTPIGGVLWEGYLLGVSEGPSPVGAILHVTVQGLSGHAVRVTTAEGFATHAATGAKEELGPYTAEFAPLTAGRYIVTPVGLNASVVVDLDRFSTVAVEFRPVADPPQPTATPTPTPVPSTSTPIPSPTPTPTPAMEWVGAVLRHDRPYQGQAYASIAVRVNGLRDLPLKLTSGDTVLTCKTGTKPEYGDYACELGGLSPGTYTVTAQGLSPVVPVMVGQGDFVLVEYRQEPVPPGQSAWRGRVVANSSQPRPGNGVSSAIAVRVEGRRGQVVSLRSADGWEAYCDTGAKPEFGDFACEFGGLWPGVYTVSPVSVPAEVRLYMDGLGFAEIAFEPDMVSVTPMPTPTRLIGAGASPIGTPPAPDQTGQIPTLTRTPSPTGGALSSTPTRSRAVATASPTPTSTLTPTPALGWVGRVVEDTPGMGIGTIVVSVLGVKDQPVVLRSGAWTMRGFTGSKSEYGDFAVEFGGLNRGDFSVELEGLGTTLDPVHLQPGGFLLVEFRYDVLPTPTPTPRRGVWVGRVTQNTSGDGWSGAWSTIIVKIPGVDSLPVTLDSGGGFTTTCVTGTKPEHGPGACEVGGLWPATYRVTPRGLGPSVDVWLDGAGSATVEFWIQ